MIWDYSRTAGIHYRKEGDTIVIHHPIPPFQNPEVRICHWWRVDPEINFDEFFYEHRLEIYPRRIDPNVGVQERLL